MNNRQKRPEWLKDKVERVEHIRALVTSGVTRPVLKEVCGFDTNVMSGIVNRAKLRFRDFASAPRPAMRELLLQHGFDASLIDEALTKAVSSNSIGSAHGSLQRMSSAWSRSAPKVCKKAVDNGGNGEDKHERAAQSTPAPAEPVEAPSIVFEKPSDEESTRLWYKELFQMAPAAEVRQLQRQVEKVLTPQPPTRTMPSADKSKCQWPVPGGIKQSLVCGAVCVDGLCEKHRIQVRRYKPLYVSA